MYIYAYILLKIKKIKSNTNIITQNVRCHLHFSLDVQNVHFPSPLLALKVAIELIEAQERETARSLLQSTQPMLLMHRTQPDRYRKLEKLLQLSYFDPLEVYGPNSSKEKRRLALAQSLSSEVVTIPPSRLMTLLRLSLPTTVGEGNYDIVRGIMKSEEVDE